MSNFHISKDGVARQCRAATPETCKATPADSKEHFDTREAAQKSYEESRGKDTLAKPVQNAKKPKANSSTYKPLPKKTFNPNVSRVENAQAKAASSKSKAQANASIQAKNDAILKVNERRRELVKIKLKGSKDILDAGLHVIDKLRNSVTDDASFYRYKTARDDRFKTMLFIRETMEKSKTFTSEEMSDYDKDFYSEKLNMGIDCLNYFYHNPKEPKVVKFFHTEKQKEKITDFNNKLKEDEKGVQAIFRGYIADPPKVYNKEKLVEILKKDYPHFANLIVIK